MSDAPETKDDSMSSPNSSAWDERGKLSGKMNGENDDLAISMMMVCYWRRHFLSSDRYAENREEIFGCA